MEELAHPSFYFCREIVLIRQPDECHEQLLVCCNAVVEDSFVLPIGLAYLTFHSIPVNSMLETFLGNADEHLGWGTTLRSVDGQIYYFERECRHRLTVTLLKERFHQLAADDALLLAKRRSHHLYVLFSLVSRSGSVAGRLSLRDISLRALQCQVSVRLPSQPWPL